MRTSLAPFIISTVTIGIAFVGVSAICSIVAYSVVERAWMIPHETVIKPFQSQVQTAEFRLSGHEQLRNILLIPSAAPVPPVL
jgi:hypothetical protein